MKAFTVLAVGALAVFAGGCAHDVTFDRPPGYAVSTARQNLGVIAVIDRATLERTVPVRAAMTGIANSWDIQPGDMLRQVADIELPQVFASYEMTETFKERPGAITLVMTVPSYRFANFHASVTVKATAYGEGKQRLFERTYSADGEAQGAKMFWGGAFAMKSAIRQSSFDAFKQIFSQLRPDLVRLDGTLEPASDSVAESDAS